MGQVLHGSVTTTEAVRRAIQRDEESERALARRCSISPTTVQKWRKRTDVSDQPIGHLEPHPTVLSIEQEVMIVAFRRHSLLPLDDCLYALRPTIPLLTRSSLHRCPLPYCISRLPDMDVGVRVKKKFKAYPIGCFHIDIAEVHSSEGKLYMFVAIDCTSKFALVRLYEQMDRPTAVLFLDTVLQAVPSKINIILTENGIQFADQPSNRNGWTAKLRVHRFDVICNESQIEHRLTNPNYPWTNGQVERMNRTNKEATIKWYFYDDHDHDQLLRHLDLFVETYNHARRLKTLKGLTPAQYIWKEWIEKPELFYEEPCHLTSGLCT